MASFGTTLATKLIPPAKRGALIERPQLSSRVGQLADYKLVLACAPAGYGKTSVLVQAWTQYQAAGRSVGWISLDEGDKDLSTFVTYWVDAARRAGLRFGQTLSAVISTGATLPTDTLHALVLNELSTLERDFYLFLDDYHLISDAGIRALINAVLLSPLHRVHLLISTRTHNELPVGRLRALGAIHEFEMADLAFSEREVGEFVGRISGVPLSQAQITRLRSGTEGWAVSLQMAGIALHGSSNVDRFLDQFSGEHRSIGDFLGEEVFRRQPPDLQAFLMATALLRRFNAALANALLGRDDGAAMIEEIERRNLLAFSLDAERRWFRYHHLFSDFLRRRLHDQHPADVAGYHQRASDWLAEHHFMTDAIEHAFSAGNIERSGYLLDIACDELFAAGQTMTLMAMSARLPRPLLDRLPRLQLERAWQNVLLWRFDDAKAELDCVRLVLQERRLAASQPDDADLVFLEAKLAHRELMLALLSDDMPVTAKLSQRWLQEGRTRDPFMCASTGSAVMAAHRELFRCEGVATSARMLHDRFVESGARYGVVFHQTIAGTTFAARGDLDRAQDAYELALQAAVELHGEHSALYNMPALMLAELHYERNELHLAEEALAQREVDSELGFVDNLIAGFLTSARLMSLRGRRAEADTLLEEGNWLATERGFLRLHAALLNERLRLRLLDGDLRGARALFNGSTMKPPPSPVTPGDNALTRELLMILALARLQLAEGDARSAALLLRPWYAHARSRHCHRLAIATGVLLARALAATADRRAAQRCLLECLQLGESGRFVRSFVDEGPELLALLADLRAADGAPAAAIDEGYLAAIVRGGEGSERRLPAADREADAVGNELLSPREMQILALAAQGNQNHDIAEQLFLADSTVKWYWQRIFDKLDVRRRPDAIKRARQNGWIA
ncbi:MAG: LuxR C-terminal-related transcriptional regulator [Gammaproteobacteria bacterium]|nr:LuxR C-terminal-related transcriptional regulator [Gammaproteobacteria bacterium]